MPPKKIFVNIDDYCIWGVNSSGVGLTGSKDNSSRQIWMVGVAMILPAVFASGPAAGYFIGQLLLVNYFNFPAWTVPVLMVLGFAASCIQVYRLIKQIKQADSQK